MKPAMHKKSNGRDGLEFLESDLIMKSDGNERSKRTGESEVMKSRAIDKRNGLKNDPSN